MALAKASRFIDVESALKRRVIDLFRRCCRKAADVQVSSVAPSLLAEPARSRPAAPGEGVAWPACARESCPLACRPSSGAASQVMYAVELTPAQMRRLVKLQFAKNKSLTDARVIDMLVVQGEMELEETMNQWKMKPHVMEMLGTTEALQASPKARDFVDTVSGQEWMYDLTLAAQIAAGVPADADMAERLKMAAADRARGSAVPPGSQVVPTVVPGMQELWDDVTTTGRTRFPDKVQTGESPAEGRTLYSRDRPMKLAPAVLQQLRDDIDAGVMSPEVEQMTATAWKQRSLMEAAGDADMPYDAPATVRAAAKLPPWMAARTRQPHAVGDALTEEQEAALRDHEVRAEGVALDGDSKALADAWTAQAVEEFRAMRVQSDRVTAMFAAKRAAYLSPARA